MYSSKVIASVNFTRGPIDWLNVTAGVKKGIMGGTETNFFMSIRGLKSFKKSLVFKKLKGF